MENLGDGHLDRGKKGGKKNPPQAVPWLACASTKMLDPSKKREEAILKKLGESGKKRNEGGSAGQALNQKGRAD